MFLLPWVAKYAYKFFIYRAPAQKWTKVFNAYINKHSYDLTHTKIIEYKT